MSFAHCQEHLVLGIPFFRFSTDYKTVCPHLCNELRVVGKFYLHVLVLRGVKQFQFLCHLYFLLRHVVFKFQARQFQIAFDDVGIHLGDVIRLALVQWLCLQAAGSFKKDGICLAIVARCHIHFAKGCIAVFPTLDAHGLFFCLFGVAGD